MKKLFSFVCALVCAISLSAQTYYIAGSSGTLFGERWNPAGMALDKQSDGTWSKTFTTCVSGKEYQFKITDGKWDNEGGTNWGFSDLASTPAGVTGDKDNNNIVCTTYDANMTVVFNPSTNKITLTGVFTNAEGGEGGDPTPDPTASYYMKHSWAGGDWAWKALTANGDGTFSIRDIYGGNGCNWNTQASNEGSKWIASPTLVGEPAKGDSAIFTLTSTSGDGAITITKISSTSGGEGGEGEDPEPTDPSETAYWYFDQENTHWEGTVGWKMTVSGDIAYVKVPAGPANKFKIFPCNPKEDSKVLANDDNIAEGALAGDIALSKDTEKWKNIIIDVTTTEYFVVLYLPNTATNSSDKYLVAAMSQLSTAISNTEVKANYTKIIRDGQVLIVREGKTFDMMGQQVF